MLAKPYPLARSTLPPRATRIEPLKRLVLTWEFMYSLILEEESESETAIRGSSKRTEHIRKSFTPDDMSLPGSTTNLHTSSGTKSYQRRFRRVLSIETYSFRGAASIILGEIDSKVGTKNPTGRATGAQDRATSPEDRFFRRVLAAHRTTAAAAGGSWQATVYRPDRKPARRES